jgi:hypothetical protein
MKFKKQDESWPFAHAEEVEIVRLQNGAVVVDDRYAMNGIASMLMHLPDVPIIEGKSVASYRKKVLGL